MKGVSMPSNVDLPPGKIDIPSAWRGEEIGANPDRWLTLLGAAEIAELENAARSYLAATDARGCDLAHFDEER